MTALEILRYSVFAIFLGASAVATAGWAVRTKRVNPAGPMGRALKGASDPALRPVERWLVKNGGNPQSAPLWVFGVALVGGIVVLSLATWLAGQIRVWSLVATSPRRVVRQVVDTLGQLLSLAIAVRVVGSWIGLERHNKWIRPAYWLTDWLILPIRRIVPLIGNIDVSGIVAYVLVQLVLGSVLRVL